MDAHYKNIHMNPHYANYVVSFCQSAIDAGNHKWSKLPKEVLELDGCSGQKTRCFVNNLVQMDRAKYLDVSSQMNNGTLAVSALYDNFSKVFCLLEEDSSLDKFMTIYKKYKGNNYTKVFTQDYKSFDISKLSKFNILMYHGRIDPDRVYGCLPHFLSAMEDVFIYIVNDINWTHILPAARKAIGDLELTVLYEKEIRLTDDGSHTPLHTAKDTWWNGLYIAVLQKKPSE
jgi:hypothetical protein